VSASVAQRQPDAAPRLLAIAALGAAVAISLGVYGRVHDPSQQLVFTLFFSSTISMKVWMASVALVLACVQLASALWVYGKLGSGAPPWAGTAHRISGRLAFIATLPVAYHCLWSFGFQDTNTRVLLPVAGGITFAVLVGVWLTSALWFIDNSGWPGF